jgi:hypothetical protein
MDSGLAAMLDRVADALEAMSSGNPEPYAACWAGSDDATLFEVIDVSEDLAYTVGFERGTVRVDGGPGRPMTIRVTHVYKRVDGDWRIIHRHADFPPLDQRQPQAGTRRSPASDPPAAVADTHRC